MTRARIPNALTCSRVVMTAALIVVLAWPPTPLLVWLALGLFGVASITDFLDGYLARKWQVTSAFGRVMDPVADKVMVLGTYVMLAGAAYSHPPDGPASGVAPWMVTLMLARELLITALRGEVERHGIAFGASLAGKAKTTLQIVGVLVILAVLGVQPPGGATINLVTAWAVLLVTVGSAVPYLVTGYRALRQPVPPGSPS